MESSPLPLALMWGMALVLGLVLGSFLNVCIARLPGHLSIVWPGSHCVRCGAAVRPLDNIPVLSWLILRGRCRDCGERISVRYLVVEIGYAGLVGASIAHFGWTLVAAAATVFCFLVLGLLVMDLETMLLPDAFTLPGLGLGLLWRFVAGPHPRSESGMRAVVTSGAWALVLLAIRWGYYLVRRRQGLGLGDVKLVAMLAAWLGFRGMAVCFFLAVVTAAMVGLASAALSHTSLGEAARDEDAGDERGWRTLQVPLGAFLCGGGLLTFFYGQPMLKWYFNFWP